jgi:hypothetical protein
MFGKKEPAFKREYFWGSTSTRVSEIRIELKDQKNTIILITEKESKNLPYPEATTLIVTRSPQNGDLLLGYLEGDKLLAQEIISGHIILRVSVEFI